jgi:choice-of-anchor C domain-containing protein
VSDLLLRGVTAGLIGLVATVLVLMAPAQPRAEAAFAGITNGSFESLGGPSGQINAGSGTLTGWTVSGAVDYVCGGWQNASGNCSLDMAATPSQGEISQILSTTVGNHYTVRFMMAGNPGCSSTSANWVTWSWPLDEPGGKTLNVSATGTAATSYSFDVAGKSDSNMGWVVKTYLFTATTTSTTLTFQNGVNQVCGAALDKIEVTEQAPGPAVLSATTWQGQRPYAPVATPNFGQHGNIGYYNYIPAPGVPAENSAAWANCGPSNSICPNASTIGLSQLSRLGAFSCLAAADFTFYQAFVSIPFGTTISQFSVNMSGADDGARVAIYNSANPGGFVFPGSYIYLGGAQSTTDMSGAMVAGEVNRVVITQVDDCYSGNNLNSAQILLNGVVIPPTPSDTTPPVITPTVVGTLGSNGWYTSDVNVSWTVTDAQSAITTQTGCAPTVVTADTASVTFTCTATSTGGTATESVTLKRDATAPVVVATAAPAPNGAGWNNTDVTVSFAGTDPMSGVSSCDVPVAFTTEASGQVASGTCIDNAGNVSAAATLTINIDKTAPAATASAAPAPNGAGWNNTDVTVTFTGIDGASGIASCTAPAVLGEGAGQSASGTCTDNAGNVSAPATASNINVDKTAPAVAVTGVTNGASYVIGGVPTAGCSTTDTLSGVATAATLSTTGGPIGPVTVTCAGAADKAGNAGASVAATYTVTYQLCPARDDDDRDDHGDDRSKGHESGSTIPVKIRVCDANGRNVGSRSLPVQAIGLSPTGSLADAGRANPGNLFRFDDGNYIFNLQTKGLAAGTYVLTFRVGNDPTVYQYTFTVRAEKHDGKGERDGKSEKDGKNEKDGKGEKGKGNDR